MSLNDTSKNNKNPDENKANQEENNKDKENKEKNNDNSNNLSSMQDLNNYINMKEIVSAFFNYQIDALRDVSRMERDFKAIGEKYTKRLPFNYEDRIAKLKQAISQNYSFLLNIAQPYRNLFKLNKTQSGEVYMEPLAVQATDIIRIRSALRLFVRDWAIEGLDERKTTYEPILNELKLFFKNKSEKDFENGINVLVPGAGLGRLLYEIAKLGFKAQGNEYSYYMVLFYTFFFSYEIKPNQFTIQPFIHTLSNLFDFETAYKKVMIPDENIKEGLSKTKTGSIFMMAGEFCSAYKEKVNSFDSVVTCFFIDTANNIIEYIETIYSTLKEGGLWINFGPLFYHHTDNPREISIELGWKELKEVIVGFGFEFTKEEIVETTYSSDKDSMIKRVYRCIFFSAVKKK